MGGMACPECRDLTAQEFKSVDQMLHALQVAGQELDRGVLRRVDPPARTDAVHEALMSAYSAQALPDAVRYAFECTTCGERFELTADMRAGTGRWSRSGEAA